MGRAWPIDPFALDKRYYGTLGDAELVSVQLIYDLICGGDSGLIPVRVDAAETLVRIVPSQMSESYILGNPLAYFAEQVGDFRADAHNNIGIILLYPFFKHIGKVLGKSQHGNAVCFGYG